MFKARTGARLLLAATAASFAFAAPAAAETLADAMVKAVSNHPSLASSRAQLRQADENVVQEAAAGLGTINASTTYTLRTTGTDGVEPRTQSDPFSLGLSGSIPIYSGGQVRYGIASAEQGVLVARSALLEVEQSILLDTVSAYEEVRAGIQSVNLARNNVRVISEQVRAARDRFDVGEVTRTDVSQAEARLAASRSNLAAAVGNLAVQRQAYLAVVGEEAEGLTAPPPIPPLPASRQEAVALALAEHPAIRQARLNARRAEYEVKRAVGAGLPSVTLNGSAGVSRTQILQENGTATNSLEVSVTASMPLWTGGRQPSNVREAQAAVAQRTAEIHQTARSLQQQTEVAWAQLDVARASIRAANQQIRAARIAFEGVKEEATLGARTTLDVLDAEAELLSARVGLVTSRRDEYVAAYTLLAAVGKLTVAHLGLDAPGFDPESYMAGVNENPYEWEEDESTRPEGEWRLLSGRP